MKKLTKNSLNKIVNTQKRSIFYTIILIILTFNLLLVSSYAWLTFNKKTTANQIDMGLNVDDTTAIYEAYMYNIRTGKGTNLLDEQTQEKLNITNLNLNQYDTIFKTQNKNTPAFAKIILTKSDSMPKNGIINLTITKKSDSQPTDILTDFSSSIIRFTLFTIPDKSDLTKLDADSLYSFINSTERFQEIEKYYGNDRDFSKTFVTVVGEGESHTHSKTDSITLSVEYTQDNWYISNENEAMNLYLYITYDTQLIDCYMEAHDSGSISLEDTSFMFENDLKKIAVSYTAIS